MCVEGGGEVWSWVYCAVLGVLSDYAEERELIALLCLMLVGLQCVIVVLLGILTYFLKYCVSLPGNEPLRNRLSVEGSS